MTRYTTIQCPDGFGVHGERFFEEVETCYCELCGGEFKKEELTEGFCAECNEIDKDC